MINLTLICLLAALLSVGAGVLCARASLPGWLGAIVSSAVLLLAFVWLQRVL